MPKKLFAVAPKESSVDDDIRDYLSSLNFVHFWKTVGTMYGQKGTQDWIVCFRGLFIGIEVKRPETRRVFQPGQKVVRLKTLEAGGISLVVDNVEDVRLAFEYLAMVAPINPAHQRQYVLGLRASDGTYLDAA